MAVRTLITPGRVLVSKAGNNASPSMPDEGKIFDSDWGFTGTLLASGYYLDPAPPHDGNPDRTLSSGQHVIVLPAFFAVRDYLVQTTYAVTRSVAYYNGGWGSRSQFVHGPLFDARHWVVDTALNALTRVRSLAETGPDRYVRYPGAWSYQVYAV
ncbi:hypothetical protein [Aureimonas glaciei]|uniref:Uncharacterized protein n=1 Tax=Aureimonas glaciei TaxID=1776957 RepID=A0A916Y3M7_9HYPH|nr:hypothetical protein [Aureimonas glaciei]GGD29248.1 hypothetical protein GCM10011335_35480 [Aureimonas glaciei]